MLKKLILFYILLTIVIGSLPLLAEKAESESVIGKTLPQIEGEILSGSETPLPHGKATLLLIGFEKNCIPYVREWLTSIRKEKLLPNTIDLYTVPVLGDSWQARLCESLVIEMLKKKVPRKEQPQVYVAKGMKQKLKEFFGVHPKKAHDFYVVLIDSKGKVRWQFSGKMNSKAKNSLKQAVSKVR